MTARQFKILAGLGGLIFLPLIIGRLIYEPFNLTSESMLPNFLPGDYILVSHLPYDDVERGDLVFFQQKERNNLPYIKRLVGLPGDTVQMRNGQLFLNGEAVEKDRIEDFVFMESDDLDCRFSPDYRFPQDDGSMECRLPQYLETLPNGKTYKTLDSAPFGRSDNTQEYVVPTGYYFSLGDSRDNSNDSRMPASAGGIGFVSEENLIGPAKIIIYSTHDNELLWESLN